MEAHPSLLAVIAGDGRARLRLWIRLLRTTRLIEREVRERLKLRFDMILPWFDVTAALHRHADGMVMSENSRFLMVSNGNVTGFVDRLMADGIVVRARQVLRLDEGISIQ